MPLMHGKSEKAFSKNVATEMDAGKPQKQSLAIAYSIKRKAQKKMAHGGPVAPIEDDRLQSDAHQCDMCGGAHSNEEHEHDRHDAMGEPMMAEGGQIRDNYQHSSVAMNQTRDEMVDPQAADDPEHEGNDVRMDHAAMEEDDRMLNQHGSIEEGPEGRMAEGGQITDNMQSDAHEEDMVERIMKMRQKRFSEGGRVANADAGESASVPDRMAKDDPNEFDDLALRDHLESSYGHDDNAGDALGNAREDKDREDMVDRIMRQRAMKARKNPNPA